MIVLTGSKEEKDKIGIGNKVINIKEETTNQEELVKWPNIIMINLISSNKQMLVTQKIEEKENLKEIGTLKMKTGDLFIEGYLIVQRIIFY